MRIDRAESGALDAAAEELIEPIVALQPELRSDAALKKIHLELLRRIRANENGVRRALSGEYLHDFRVAVRRTRTGLRQLEDVYPRAPAERFASDFKWLSKTTGRSRDLEVYLGSFARFHEQLDEGDVEALEPFVSFLEEHQRSEQARCREALDSRRYATMLRDWDEFLRTPAAGGPDGDRPVVDVAAERIEAAFRRVVRRGTELREDAPAAAFHKLRLDCKKLRYLLEFFGNLFCGEAGVRAIVALKRTQDSLGAINDLRVQKEWLARFPDASSGAACRLGDHLEERQRGERASFVGRFATFIGEESSAALRGFLRHGASIR